MGIDTARADLKASLTHGAPWRRLHGGGEGNMTVECYLSASRNIPLFPSQKT